VSGIVEYVRANVRSSPGGTFDVREKELIDHFNFATVGEPDRGHHVRQRFLSRGSLSDHDVDIGWRLKLQTFF